MHKADRDEIIAGLLKALSDQPSVELPKKINWPLIIYCAGVLFLAGAFWSNTNALEKNKADKTEVVKVQGDVRVLQTTVDNNTKAIIINSNDIKALTLSRDEFRSYRQPLPKN